MCLGGRVRLILDFLRYRFWSSISERTVSEDSKFIFVISISDLETHCKPLKDFASTVNYRVKQKINVNKKPTFLA